MMSQTSSRLYLAALAWPLLACLAAAGENGSACPATGPVCATVCAEVCKKVCVPRVEPGKKVTPVYSMKCEDLCLPKCTCFFGCLKTGCGEECGPTCAKCGKPRVVRKLVKKFKTEDECKVKCHVEMRMELVPVKHRKCEPADCPECVAPVHPQ